MPEQASGSIEATIGGRQYSMRIDASGDLKGGASPRIGPAIAGTLSARTDNDTGSVALPTGHGQTSGDYDIYWADGRRRKMTGTVTGDTLALDLGTGDNLPVVGTAVTVMKQNVETPTFDGDTVVGFGVKSPNFAGTVAFEQVDGTLIFPVELEAGGSYAWTNELGITNPLAGQTVGRITFTHGGSGAASDMYADWVYESA